LIPTELPKKFHANPKIRDKKKWVERINGGHLLWYSVKGIQTKERDCTLKVENKTKP
jgi:hypothetical protein